MPMSQQDPRMILMHEAYQNWRSGSNTPAEMDRKRREYFDAGSGWWTWTPAR
jgi:hypothetical protein